MFYGNDTSVRSILHEMNRQSLTYQLLPVEHICLVYAWFWMSRRLSNGVVWSQYRRRCNRVAAGVKHNQWT